MLTRKQRELLLLIEERLQQQAGVSPSYDEMKEALGLKSKSGIHRLVTALEERGFIRRIAHRARALEVLRHADGRPFRRDEDGQGSRPPVRSFSPNVIAGGFPGVARAAAARAGSPPSDSEAVSLPLYGRIAAGTPIEALRDYSNSVEVPASMLAGGDHFALEVAGDSMVDAGILNGDTVVIQRCDTVETGTIVVALVDEAEVTLKRLRRRGASIALEPANPNYETRIFGPDQIRIQGRLIGLLRQY